MQEGCPLAPLPGTFNFFDRSLVLRFFVTSPTSLLQTIDDQSASQGRRRRTGTLIEVWRQVSGPPLSLISM
jgi:hypothetical protein